MVSAGMLVSSGVPGVGLLQGHGAEEVSASTELMRLMLFSSLTRLTLCSPQALHLGDGLSETVQPRQRLQAPQRVSLVPHPNVAARTPTQLLSATLLPDAGLFFSSYLQVEWEVRRGTPRLFTPDTMRSSNCRVPQQDNSSDCGLYLLQYVESFLQVRTPISTSTHQPVLEHHRT